MDDERPIEPAATTACRLRGMIERLSAEQERKLVADYLRIDGEPPQYAHGVADLANRMDDIRTARYQLLLACDQLVEEDADDDDDDEAEDDDEPQHVKDIRELERERDQMRRNKAMTAEQRRTADLAQRILDTPLTAQQVERLARQLPIQSSEGAGLGGIPCPTAEQQAAKK